MKKSRLQDNRKYIRRLGKIPFKNSVFTKPSDFKVFSSFNDNLDEENTVYNIYGPYSLPIQPINNTNDGNNT
jgi:hypothetical protein